MTELVASTARIIAGMALDDLEVYGAAVGLDPTRSDLPAAILDRIADPDWVLAMVRPLSGAARCALVVAAWACPDTVEPFELIEEASGEGATPADLADLDASGLWLGEPAMGPDDPSRRLVPPVTAAVIRAHAAKIVGARARLTAMLPGAEPGARLIRSVAALADVDARLRKDGGVVRTYAARVAERLPGFDPAGDDDASLGLLARIALRSGWLAWTGEGGLRLDAAALSEGAPSRRDLIGVVVSGTIAAVPPLGPALAALACMPELTAVPLSVYDGILSASYDPRVHALDPAAAEAIPPVHAAVGLLALGGIVLVAQHDEELFVLLHPEARAALRAEHRLASVAAPTVQADREVLFQPDCPAEDYWRLASLCASVAFDVVDRWQLSEARLQAAVDGGLDLETVRRWVADCSPDGEVAPIVDGWLRSVRGPDDRCELLTGVPARMGEVAIAALQADPALAPLLLEHHGPLAILHPDALAALPAWARASGIRLAGADRTPQPHAPAPHRPVDWRPLPSQLASLLADLLEPLDAPSFLPGCEELVYPPLLALGADDAAAEAAERLVSTLLVRAPRDAAPPSPAPDPGAQRRAWDAAPPAWRRLSHALSVDLPALLAAALEAHAQVEVHAALGGGRRVVTRTFVPGALEPPGAPVTVFPANEPAPIRLRDIRAIRLVGPVAEPGAEPSASMQAAEPPAPRHAHPPRGPRPD